MRRSEVMRKRYETRSLSRAGGHKTPESDAIHKGSRMKELINFSVVGRT